MDKIITTPSKRRQDFSTPSKRISLRGRSLTPSLKALENLALEDNVPGISNSLRRSRRTSNVTPSLKAFENLALTDDVSKTPNSLRRNRRTINDTPTRSNYNRNVKSLKRVSSGRRLEILSESCSDEDILVDENLKPELFIDELDVDGKKIYGFNTPKKRDAMLKLVLNTPKTPSTRRVSNVSILAKTPNSNKKIGNNLEAKRKKNIDMPPKTPRLVRTILKKEISKHVNSIIDSDFSTDESEYQKESSSEESDENDITINESTVTSEDNEKSIKKIPKNHHEINVPILSKTPSRNQLIKPVTRVTRQSKKINEFIPESEGYFISHSNRKIVTSDHTLDRLKSSRLPADRICTLLKSMKISTEHEEAISDLLQEYKSKFSKWMFILNEGFNIVLYGLGSKQTLLQSFHCKMLANYTVLVVNGFFPSLTIKDILDGILIDILEFTSVPSNSHEAAGIIEEELNKLNESHIFLIVHNIDGPMLRNSKAQEILSRLAKIKNIHLIASIDHINTPLLWDHTKLSNYNFSWWDVTTMLPYSDETAFENSLLLQHSGELELSSMRNVFLSLTSNGKGIFLFIVKKHLENKGNGNFQGVLFKELYWGCREAFLVSSDIALRAQLTEFIDHKLVKNKRDADGSETLKIPIKLDLLAQFLEEQKDYNSK